MTHNMPNWDDRVFRKALEALQRVWKVLKSKEGFDVMSMTQDEISAYYDLIDFCEAILESEIPELDPFD